MSEAEQVPAPLDWAVKGLPASVGRVALADVGAQGWNVLRQDMMLPVAVLSASALAHNGAWMRRFTGHMGVRLCPHGKTTMSPQLFAMQLADGAWGLTAATVDQVRIYRRFGVGRVILANQLIGRQAIGWVAAELRRDPAFDFYALVDSLEGVAQLDAALAVDPVGRPLQLLLEVGVAGGRAGVRDRAQALAIAAAVAASPRLALRGIEAFEGVLHNCSRGGDDACAVAGLLEQLTGVAEACAAAGLFAGRPLVTAGGSAFFDLAARILSNARLDAEVVLRSGCYLVHDSDYYEGLVAQAAARSPEVAALGGLRSALTLWAYVLSRPEPGRVIAGIGKRDLSYDAGMPRALAWARPGPGAAPAPLADHGLVRLDDHHAYLDVPADSPLAPGDMLAFGISHPCTTFDRWPALFLVDDALTVTGAVRTYF